jgi:hypothetical protein
MPPSDTSPAKVFFSYAHKDEESLLALKRHLTPLVRANLIEDWYDRDIDAGDEWRKEIDEHLNQADLILLLVSSFFIASEYCYDVEFKRAEELHAQGKARLIPIIVSSVYLKCSPLAEFQALPKDAKPLSEWPDREQALTNVVEGISAVVDLLRGKEADAQPHRMVSAPGESAPSSAPELSAKEAPEKKSPAKKRKLSPKQYRDRCGNTVLKVLRSLPPEPGMYLYPDIPDIEEAEAAKALELPDLEGIVGVIGYTVWLRNHYIVFGDSGVFLGCDGTPRCIPYSEFGRRNFGKLPEGHLDLGLGETVAMSDAVFNADYLLSILLKIKTAVKTI